MPELNERQEEFLKEIEAWTVLELSTFVKAFEDRFDVSAQAAVAVGAVAAAPGAAPVEEKTEFEVHLTAVGSQKVQVIKTVRQFTDLGLKEAKGVVDKAPGLIKDGVSKEDAEKMKAAFTEVGATVEIK